MQKEQAVEVITKPTVYAQEQTEKMESSFEDQSHHHHIENNHLKWWKGILSLTTLIIIVLAYRITIQYDLADWIFVLFSVPTFAAYYFAEKYLTNKEVVAQNAKAKADRMKGEAEKTSSKLSPEE